jgi:predicted nucleotidyltransferase
MVEVPVGVTTSVERFLALVRRTYRVDAAYLYGSQVKGTASKWSDIDLAIVSSDFSTNTFMERVALLRLALSVDDRLEPQPFRPEAFGPDSPLVGEILLTGRRVA